MVAPDISSFGLILRGVATGRLPFRLVFLPFDFHLPADILKGHHQHARDDVEAGVASHRQLKLVTLGWLSGRNDYVVQILRDQSMNLLEPFGLFHVHGESTVR